MQGNLKKHINSEQVKICFNVRNVMNHLDPEVTLMMEMVLVAIKDVLSNVVVQDVDEFLWFQSKMCGKWSCPPENNGG